MPPTSGASRRMVQTLGRRQLVDFIDRLKSCEGASSMCSLSYSLRPRAALRAPATPVMEACASKRTEQLI